MLIFIIKKVKCSAFIQLSIYRCFCASLNSTNTGLSYRRLKNVTLSFGPNHPAAHGILKMVLQLNGEVIQRADPQFGFLHRGSEKLSEDREYLKALPYFDRMDYVANLFQEHAFCLAVEDLLLERGNKMYTHCLTHIRVLFDELSRVLNHLLTLSATCLDVGSMGPIFWAFEERERIMEFYERLTGARMHTALYKPLTFEWTAINKFFLLDLAKFLTRCNRAISGAVMGLLNNKVLKTRLRSVGSISKIKSYNYGLTGIIARSSGIKKDLRLTKNVIYGAYWNYSFVTYLGYRGDNMDRFLLRVKESFECFKIVSQVLSYLNLYLINYSGFTKFDTQNSHVQDLNPNNFFYGELRKVWLKDLNSTQIFNVLNERSKFTAMEELINHFKYYSSGLDVNAGIAYGAVEGPKGEVGVTIVITTSSSLYRLKVRTPVSHNMNVIPSFACGYVFGDFVMTFCSLDIVLGEIDR